MQGRRSDFNARHIKQVRVAESCGYGRLRVFAREFHRWLIDVEPDDGTVAIRLQPSKRRLTGDLFYIRDRRKLS